MTGERELLHASVFLIHPSIHVKNWLPYRVVVGFMPLLTHFLVGIINGRFPSEGGGHFIVVFSHWALKMWARYIHRWLELKNRVPSIGGSCPLTMPTSKRGHGFRSKMWCWTYSWSFKLIPTQQYLLQATFDLQYYFKTFVLDESEVHSCAIILSRSYGLTLSWLSLPTLHYQT